MWVRTSIREVTVLETCNRWSLMMKNPQSKKAKSKKTLYQLNKKQRSGISRVGSTESRVMQVATATISALVTALVTSDLSPVFNLNVYFF